jgi:hypothetical protein
MRVIIAARLSVGKKGGQQGGGIETQDKRAREWAEYEGHTVVQVIKDTKSGTVAPWDRPNLRPWVTFPELMSQYDGIVAYSMDRLSRAGWKDESKIRMWAEEHGKTLLIAYGPQWPQRNEGDFWSWTALANQAHKEWESIVERTGRERERLWDLGSYVGKPTFAYKVVGEYEGKGLAVIDGTDPGDEINLAYYAEQFYLRCIGGDSYSSIARWVTDEGIPPAGGAKKWGPNTIRNILKNPTYKGEHCKKVYEDYEDENGKPQQSWLGYGDKLHDCPAIVSPTIWALAQEAMKGRLCYDKKRGPRTEEARQMLSGIVFCMRCGKKMSPSGANRYYTCAGGNERDTKICRNGVRADFLERVVSELISQRKETIKELVAALTNEDIRKDIDSIDKKLNNLPHKYRGEDDDAEDAERRRLRKKRKELVEESKKDAKSNELDTGESYRDHWAKLEGKARGTWLRQRARITGGKIYAFAGTKDGDEERLLKAIGQPGCALLSVQQLPQKTFGIYVLDNFKLLLGVEAAAEEDDDWQEALEELTRLTALGRSEWNVGDPALVLAAQKVLNETAQG